MSRQNANEAMMRTTFQGFSTTELFHFVQLFAILMSAFGSAH